MKKLIYTLHAAAFVVLAVSCEQELVDNSASPCPSDDPSIVCPEAPAPENCTPGASAGNADFSKFVAIGTSYSAGFQAGALFTEGQENSLPKILSTQFACVGGGAFNQPSIKSEHGFNLFVTPNPDGTTVRGRFRLQGTPPQPAPVVAGADAVPNPMANPGFMYTGSTGSVGIEDLNNFSVPAIYIGQTVIHETGDWTKAGSDPRFSPFYARFSSDPGGISIIDDAIKSVENDGTFVLYWLGMDDVLLNAAYGGDDDRAPLTELNTFKAAFNFTMGTIFQGHPTIEGVVANIPDPFIMPHFNAIAWNQIPLDADRAALLTTNLANNYNAFLDGMVQATFISADEAQRRKVSFKAGQNPILFVDDKLTDLSPYMTGQYAALLPYAQARQTTEEDIIPLSAGTVLGREVAPNVVLGVSAPLEDRYVLSEEEADDIRTRLDEINDHIKTELEKEPYKSQLAFVDVKAGLQAIAAAQGSVVNGVIITPNINPPTGIYSEDGLHPNSRGYAYIANMFIDAINAKFTASVPKVNLTKYKPTGFPLP